MSWEGYWWPQLVSWTVGGAITAVVGVIAGVLFRRLVLRPVRELLTQTAEHAQSGAVSASQAASDASAARVSSADVIRRLKAVEGQVGGIRDGISASLGHRARDDLRFKSLSEQLEQLRADRGIP